MAGMGIRNALARVAAGAGRVIDPRPAQLALSERGYGWLISQADDVVLIPSGGDTQDASGYYSRIGGAHVTPYAAKCLPIIFACDRVITQAMVQAEARLVRTLADGTTEVVTDHPVARMFTIGPNALHTQAEMMDMMASDLNLYGQCFAQIMRTRRGVAAELEPLSAADVYVDGGDWDERGRIIYNYNGATGGAARIIYDRGQPAPLLHVRMNASADFPYEGKSPIRFLRETVTSGLLATEFQRKTLSSGGHAQMALSTDQDLAPNEMKKLAAEWEKATKGVAAWNRTPILPSGLKAEQLALSQADMQFLELQRWGKEEMCGVFRVPPPMVADLSKANLNNMRELFRSFNRLTMAPLFMLWSQAIRRDLLVDEPDLSMTFHADEKSDPDSLIKQLAVGHKIGSLTPLQIGRMMGWEYDPENLPSDEYKAAGGGDFGDFGDDDSLMPDDPKGENPTPETEEEDGAP